MNKWARLAAAFQILMGLIELGERMKAYTGSKTSPEFDAMVADAVDTSVTIAEVAVGRDFIDNAKIRAAVLASLDDIIVKTPPTPPPPK